MLIMVVGKRTEKRRVRGKSISHKNIEHQTKQNCVFDTRHKKRLVSMVHCVCVDMHVCRNDTNPHPRAKEGKGRREWMEGEREGGAGKGGKRGGREGEGGDGTGRDGTGRK
jgi:hypothetical protein